MPNAARSSRTYSPARAACAKVYTVLRENAAPIKEPEQSDGSVAGAQGITSGCIEIPLFDTTELHALAAVDLALA